MIKLKKAVCVALRCKSNFLLLKRSSKENYSGVWEFPAGSVEKDESFENAAKRELEEETNIYVNKIDLIGKFYRTKDKEPVEFHFFLADVETSEISLSEEHDAFKWLNETEINSFCRTQKVGIDTLRLLNLYRSRVLKEVTQLFVRKISEKYSKEDIGIMLVGSVARYDYLINWSDIDIVVFFNNEITMNDMNTLRNIQKDLIGQTNQQIWLKIHDKNTFPKALGEESKLNYLQDGRLLYGIDIKQIIGKENIIEEKVSKKAEGMVSNKKFFWRYYYASVVSNNLELGSIHTDLKTFSRKTNEKQKNKFVLAQMIDIVTEAAQYILYLKTDKMENDKFIIASLLIEEFKNSAYSDIPLKLLFLREKIWGFDDFQEEDYKKAIDMTFDFFEKFISSFVKDRNLTSSGLT